MTTQLGKVINLVEIQLQLGKSNRQELRFRWRKMFVDGRICYFQVNIGISVLSQKSITLILQVNMFHSYNKISIDISKDF